MSNNNEATAGGIGFFGLLAIIFITLKLTETGTVATWSWWWVLSPLWGGFALVIAALMLILFFGFLWNAMVDLRNFWKKN